MILAVAILSLPYFVAQFMKDKIWLAAYGLILPAIGIFATIVLDSKPGALGVSNVILFIWLGIMGTFGVTGVIVRAITLYMNREYRARQEARLMTVAIGYMITVAVIWSHLF